MVIKVEGIDDIMRNLNKEIRGIKRRTRGGLRAGGLIVQGEAQKRSPVDSDNLRKSAYTQVEDQYGRYVAIVGFTAEYALEVHENVEQWGKGKKRTTGTKKGTYWETGEPRFLANALREKQSAVINTIKKRARVKR